MRKYSLLVIVALCMHCIAQTIVNPVFDRSDTPSFYIKKIEITKDTTFITCSFYAEAGLWASISKETYLRDSKSHRIFPIQRCEGLPYAPEERIFTQNESCELLFCFPSIAGGEQFDFIESEDERGFNIYGICLKKQIKTSYSDTELRHLSEMASAYYSSNATEKAMQLKEYATSLNNLISYNVSKGNFSEAIRLGTVEARIKEKVFGKEDSSYIGSLENLTAFNIAKDNYVEAIRLKTELSNVLKETIGTDNNAYATSLGELASFYAHIGNYLEAKRLGAEVVEIYKKFLGANHIQYAIALDNLSVFYAYLGNYSESIALGKESLKIKRDVLGTENFDYAQSLNNLASYYSNIGDYSESIMLGKEAVDIKKNVLGIEHPEYALSLRNLALFYSEVGDYTEALKLGREVLDIRRKVLGKAHPDYARSLHDLAVVFSCIGNDGEALRLLAEATKIRKNILGANHPDYAFSLNDLALCYARTGYYAEGINNAKEALEIRKMFLGTEHPDYASSLNDLAECYLRGGNFDEAVKTEKAAVELRKNILGSANPYYTRSLLNLTIYYFYHGDFLKAYNCATQYIEGSKSLIHNNFSELSSHFQETLWKSSYAYPFVCVLPSVFYKIRHKESASELYDNACLFAKGLLLNTSLEMRRLILEGGDSVIINKYNALSSNINLYNKLIEKPIKERFMNADSLNRVIEQQEIELARESKVYGDYAHNLTISWKDVQSKLGDNDIAVEFLDFPVLNSDSTVYVALTLKREYDCPHIVVLFEKKQLKAIPGNSYYTQSDVSDLIWKPLVEELNGVKNIYFAPSGEIHRIGIENLPFNKSKTMSDVYSLHRLSSTRQLAVIQDESQGQNTILYGGINYDEKSYAVTTDSSSTKKTDLRSAFTYRANVDSLSLRNSYDYLEGTKKEADLIAEGLKLRNVPYHYYSGTDATEESVKNLNGTYPKVIHIATHGFYITEEEANKLKFARSEREESIGNDHKIAQQEYKPMTRSGLLFSGCNHIIRHEQIPDGEEDGILTAQEISTLDLRGLDLVVLSACQTGLGDIVSGEGVFGLQRGFKMAGAKTIVMSLWNVNDESTMKMMTSFYRHYLEGMSKEEAFRVAQDELRKTCLSKQERPDWAAFIMLDGLN